MKWLNNIRAMFVNEPNLATIKLFRRALYVYLLFNFLQLLPMMSELYGSQSLIIAYDFKTVSITSVLNLLSIPTIENWHPAFFAAQILFCGLGFFNVLPRISAIVVWFTTINLNNRVYLMNTGGEQLINVMLFYLMFVSSGKKNESIIRNVFDNTFIAACKIQVIMVYALSALYKLLQPEWLDGSALYYVFNMDEFTTLFLQEHSTNTFLIKAITYFALAYQALFPILVFIKRVKMPLLIMGVALHIGIALTVGLINFSLIMICCYLLFVESSPPAPLPRRGE